MYSVVVTSATLPFQSEVALMPNRLWLELPSFILISCLPQPDSSAAWPRMWPDGMPEAASAALAASWCLRMNCSLLLRRLPSEVVVALLAVFVRALPRSRLCARRRISSRSAPLPPGNWVASRSPRSPSWPRPLKELVPATRLRVLALAVVPPVAPDLSAVSGLMPIWRSSCLAMASASPPGRPLIWPANWVSSMPVAISEPLFSNMPLDMVEARMLFISSPMNRLSSCFAVSRTAARGLVPDVPLRRSSDRRSMVRPLVAAGLFTLMSDHLQLGLERAGRLHGLQDGQQVLRVGAQGVERLDDIGQLAAGGQLDDVAGFLVDADVGFFGDHGLPLRQGVGLADNRGGADGHRQVAVGHCAGGVEVVGLQVVLDGAALCPGRGHGALDRGASGDAAGAQVVDGDLGATCGGASADHDHVALRERVDLAIGALERGGDQGAAAQRLGVAQRRDVDVQGLAGLGEGGQGGRHQHGHHVLELHVGASRHRDAHLLEH